MIEATRSVLAFRTLTLEDIGDIGTVFMAAGVTGKDFDESVVVVSRPAGRAHDALIFQVGAMYCRGRAMIVHGAMPTDCVVLDNRRRTFVLERACLAAARTDRQGAVLASRSRLDTL